MEKAESKPKDKKAAAGKPVNVHAHHRDRMRERFRLHGEDNFEDHELLECLLFEAIPRANTNPIAHDLLLRFGSLAGVLDATPEDLASTPGVGKNTAIFLKIVRAAMHRIELQQASAVRFDSDEIIGRYLVRFFDRAECEQAVLLLFDKQKRLKQTCVLARGSLEAAAFDLPALLRKSLAPGVAFIAVAHNHPSGIALPSSTDISTTELIKEMCTSLGVGLIDHYIVAGATCFGVRHYLAKGEEIKIGEVEW